MVCKPAKCLVMAPAKYHTSQRHKLWMGKSHVVWDRNCFVAQSRCFLDLGFPGNWIVTIVSLPYTAETQISFDPGG